jgi:hypothetical protein
MSALEQFHTLLREVLADPQAKGWRTKWQWTCQYLWKGLEADHQASISDDDLNDFVHLLTSDKRMFSLASLVIDPLRDNGEPDVDLHHQQHLILQATLQQRKDKVKFQSSSQPDFDDPLYVEEKRRAMDAELHRARVLLHQSGAFGSQSEEAIKQWLLKHPEVLSKADP